MEFKVSHDWRDETPEAKARCFQSLPLSQRMELPCAFTDLALSLRPDLPEREYPQPPREGVRILRLP